MKINAAKRLIMSAPKDPDAFKDDYEQVFEADGDGDEIDADANARTFNNAEPAANGMM